MGRVEASERDEREKGQRQENNAWKPLFKDHFGSMRVGYHLLSKRMSSQKALVAIARKLLVVIWNVLAKEEPYKPNEYENKYMKQGKVMS